MHKYTAAAFRMFLPYVHGGRMTLNAEHEAHGLLSPIFHLSLWSASVISTYVVARSSFPPCHPAFCG